MDAARQGRNPEKITTETQSHGEIREGFSGSLPSQREKPETNAENKSSPKEHIVFWVEFSFCFQHLFQVPFAQGERNGKDPEKPFLIFVVRKSLLQKQQFDY